MDSTTLHRLMKRAVPFLPLTVLVLALLILTIHPLPGCRWNSDMVGYQPVPVPEGTPTIRVSLTGGYVRSASLSATGAHSLNVDGMPRISSSSAMHNMPVSRSGGTWIIGMQRIRGREVILSGCSGGYVKYDGKPYRGTLHLVATGDNIFRVVNYVDMESYLAGVIAKELYVHWHEQTYRAQAVAARTYAMYHMMTGGKSRDYDVGIGQAWQVYEGILAETPKSWAAVDSTSGWTLAYGPDGQEKIFQALYSACNGGYVNGMDTMRYIDDIPPLRGGQKDDDGRKCPKYNWPPVRVSKADIFAAIVKSYSKTSNLGGVKTVRVESQTSFGRAMWIEVLGTSGKTKTRLRAEDLRVSLGRYGVKGLYSMNCKMRDLGNYIEFYDGRGHGHGVGMSQWGAEDKANRGRTGEQILDFYYPEAKIIKAY